MTKKQTNGLIVAAIIFVVAGVISVLTNALSSKLTKQNEESAANSLNSIMDQLYGSDSLALADMPVTEDYIAVVPIEGTIQASGGATGLYAGATGYNHKLLMNYVDKLIEALRA